MRKIHVNYFRFGSVIQKEMSLKDFRKLALAAILFGGGIPFARFW